jgi:hypothetical protein
VSTTIWARADRGRIGVRRAPNLVEIPGWLLAMAPFGLARPESDGRFAAVVAEDVPAAFARLALDPGRWRVRVLGRGAPVVTEVRASGDTLRLARGVDPAPFAFAGGEVDFVLRAQVGAESRIASVAFERVGR